MTCLITNSGTRIWKTWSRKRKKKLKRRIRKSKTKKKSIWEIVNWTSSICYLKTKMTNIWLRVIAKSRIRLTSRKTDGRTKKWSRVLQLRRRKKIRTASVITSNLKKKTRKFHSTRTLCWRRKMRKSLKK
jgi:hypothetical protein